LAARRYESGGNRFSTSFQGADATGMPQAMASNILIVGMPGSERA